MTALETLIRTASNDAAPHYRELAREAQRELEQLLLMKKQRDDHSEWLRRSIMLGPEPIPPPGMKREDVIEEITIQGPTFSMLVPKESCTPTNFVDK